MSDDYLNRVNAHLSAENSKLRKELNELYERHFRLQDAAQALLKGYGTEVEELRQGRGRPLSPRKRRYALWRALMYRVSWRPPERDKTQIASQDD